MSATAHVTVSPPCGALPRLTAVSLASGVVWRDPHVSKTEPNAERSRLRDIRGRVHRGRVLAGRVGVLLCVLAVRWAPAADCNGNGVLDDLELDAGAVDDCNADGTPDVCEQAPPPFLAANFVRLRTRAQASAVGDLDGDGVVEYVFVRADRLHVLTYRSDGGAEGGVDDHEYAIAGFATEVHTADLDGDGHLDVLVVADNQVLILINDGSGLLGDDTRLGFDGVVRVAVGDLDGAGGSDIVLSRRAEGHVRILISASDGLFEEPIDVPFTSRVEGMATGDFDGDGDQDIGVAGRSPGPELFVLWNDGDGSFRVEEIEDVALDDQRFLTVDAADLDGDGVSDLVVLARTEVLVRRGGTRGFAELQIFSLASFEDVALVRALSIADVSGDGQLDVVLASERNDIVLLLEGAGDGSFSSAQTFRADVPGVGVAEIEGVFVGNLDSDGDTDILVETAAPDGLLYLFQDPKRRLRPVASGSNLSFESSVVLNRDPRWEPHSTGLADFDGDGDLDIAAIDGENFCYIRFNTPVDRFSEWMRLDVRRSSEMISLATADFDGSGSPDIVLADEATERVFVVFVDRGDEGITLRQSEQIFSAGERPYHVSTADVTGNGAPDIICVVQGQSEVVVYENDGGGVFAEFARVAAGTRPTSATTGDFDLDGDTDIATSAEGGGGVSVLWNDGQGAFAQAAWIDVPSPVYVHAVDLDLDSGPELVVASDAAQRLEVFGYDGRGRFERRGRVDLGQRPFSIGSADLDGDGRPEVISANPRDRSISIVPNELGGLFGPVRFPTGEDPRFAVAGDIDGDGDNDVISADHTSRSFTVLTNQTSEPLTDGSFADRICTERDFYRFAIPTGNPGPVEWLTKYVLPADPDDPELLGAKFQNVGRHPLHQEFLAEVFPGVIPPGRYDALVNRRETRDYYVGVLYRIVTDEGPLYGFNVLSAFVEDRSELPGPEEVAYVYAALDEIFTIGDLAYFPDETATREDAEGWESPGFPIYLGRLAPETGFQAYTRGIGYGRVRVLSSLEALIANANGQLGFQDIVVFEEPPRDIDGVVAAVITDHPQGALSHLGVRTARRGTPNAFVDGASDIFEEIEGELIRIEISGSDYTVTRDVEVADAESWWERIRPQVPPLPPPDTEYAELDSLEEIAILGAGVIPTARYGGKATNMARLRGILVDQLARFREDGFAVPMRYYAEFMHTNRMPSALDGNRLVTYAGFVDEILGWDEFRSDSLVRVRTLSDLREHMRDDSEVDGDLVRRVAERVGEVFGDTGRRVRMRSSSNAEDLLEFNGAGLYESTSACAADDLDADDVGPSACNQSWDDERGIADALRTVWGGLWNFRAFEEREYYRLTHVGSHMGVYVSRAFVDERANGVAFTGNPLDPSDGRYLVTVQVGEESVVDPDPGVIPETTLLRVVDGSVVEITRQTTSSLLPEGGVVLTDERLRELGNLLAHIDRNFPLSLGDHERSDVLLDVEFKIDAQGDLAIKQVRPFLRPTPTFPSPIFELQIPEGQVACGAFVETRTARRAFELKSRIRFRPGIFELPTRGESFELTIIDEVTLGAEDAIATASGPGIFRVTRESVGDIATFRFRYEQLFDAPGDGGTLRIEMTGASFRSRGVESIDGTLRLDDVSLAERLRLHGDIGFVIDYLSCGQERLPLWGIDVELEDGQSIRLLERHEPPPTPNDTGPAALVEARVVLGARDRVVSDYWHLAYTALRHNGAVEHWVIFAPPFARDLPLLPIERMRVIGEDTALGIEPDVELFSQPGVIVSEPSVVSYRRTLVADVGDFLRGDVFADGVVTISDAVFTLNYLFTGGSTPGCLDAADVDDDGFVTLSDAVRVLGFLFLEGAPPPTPWGECGEDPGDDGLDCAVYGECR